MTNKIDQYVKASTRENTRLSYQSAVEHFEVTWGGFLPTTANRIAQYLADHGDTLALNTLKLRLAALAQWHITQGFPDPTKAPIVRNVMKGIKALHPSREKRATPLQLNQLEKVVDWLNSQIIQATMESNAKNGLMHRRDKALILIGFWRGFRSDELSRLEINNITVIPHEGMTLYLSRTKSDRMQQGQTFKTPALSQLCPVEAYLTWIEFARLDQGPVFRSINRWGTLGGNALNASSITYLLRRIFEEAGLEGTQHYSSHSLRRGFATWANDAGWNVKSLMEYVGWQDVKSAMRYIDNVEQYAKQKIESDFEKRLLPKK